MELKVYKEQEKVPEDSTITEVYLKLTTEAGRITLEACDKNGKRLVCGCLISITTTSPAPTVHLHGSIDPKLGFELTPDGQLVTNLTKE